MSLSILIVDDDVTYLHILKRTLTEYVNSAASPIFLTARKVEDALKLYDEHAAGLDLIFCDLNMPGLSGLDFLHDVRERDSGIPFILLSTLPDQSSIAQARKAGVTAFIVKPFSIGQLHAKLSRALSDDAGDPIAAIQASRG